MSMYHQNCGRTKKLIGIVICVLSSYTDQYRYHIHISGSPKLLRDPHIHKFGGP